MRLKAMNSNKTLTIVSECKVKSSQSIGFLIDGKRTLGILKKLKPTDELTIELIKETSKINFICKRFTQTIDFNENWFDFEFVEKPDKQDGDKSYIFRTQLMKSVASLSQKFKPVNNYNDVVFFGKTEGKTAIAITDTIRLAYCIFPEDEDANSLGNIKDMAIPGHAFRIINRMLKNKEISKVPMILLSVCESFQYSDNSIPEAETVRIELPCKSGKITMIVTLPNNGGFPDSFSKLIPKESKYSAVCEIKEFKNSLSLCKDVTTDSKNKVTMTFLSTDEKLVISSSSRQDGYTNEITSAVNGSKCETDLISLDVDINSKFLTDALIELGRTSSKVNIACISKLHAVIMTGNCTEDGTELDWLIMPILK